jgi:DNA-binding CsgD family transcriptional regulator
VGKSRIGREALRLAGDAGFSTAYAVATQAASMIPLGALAALLPVADARREHRDAVVGGAVAALTANEDGAPRALLVDDAHLLDATSAAVLLQVAMSPTTFVVVTVRSGEPVPDAVVALWREGIAERIDLANLDRAHTDALVQSVLDGPVDGRTRRDLWHASHGNPLVLRELVLGALEVEFLADVNGMWRLTSALAVPPRLAELVSARLADASSDERAVLEILALGEPLGLATLVELTSAEAVDSAERRGLLRIETSGRRREARLAHPTHGEVLRSEMTALRGMSLNRLLAEAVQATGARRREDVLRVAIWRLEGGGHVHAELMLEAARQAYFARDDALTERLARAAFDDGGGVEAALLLGEVLGSGGRHAEAESLLAHAAGAVETDRQWALVAMARADALYWGLAQESEARATLLEAEAAVGDQSWRHELAGARATYELLAGRPQHALAAVEPLLAVAEGRPLVEAATVAAPALAVSGRTDDAVELAERALATRLALGEQQVLADTGIHVAAKVLALGAAGRLREGLETAAASYDAALEARTTSGVAWASLMLGWIALLHGRLATAARSLGEGAGAFSDVGQMGPHRWCVAAVALATGQSGDAAATQRAIDQLDALPESPLLMMETEVERARAWNAMVRGDIDGSRRWLLAATARARAGGALALEAGALHDLARIGGAAEAAPRLGELADAVDGKLVEVRAAHADALAHDDAEALDACADTFEELGAMLFAAEAAAASAAAHRRAHSARRAQRARRRAAALAAECERPGTPALALAGPAGALTPREREIATLAAHGATSAAIAERLVVGVRTVESHLQHAYEKLGVRSRTELAAALADDPASG